LIKLIDEYFLLKGVFVFMYIPVAKEVLPFFIGSLIIFGGVGAVLHFFRRTKLAYGCYVLAVISACYMLFFFRDPERIPLQNESLVLAGADGSIAAITNVVEKEFIKGEAVRVSIFLSLFDVHINRSPIGGGVAFAQYYPGKRYFTFQEKSSEFNQHSSILIKSGRTVCLVNQIVGPVARRVVFWLKPGDNIGQGSKIGMMKFGSRLDIYIPEQDVAKILVNKGDKVSAGITPIIELKAK
jgi:phosphatidylserine decarboxylase